MHGELCQSSHAIKDFIHRGKIGCSLERKVTWATEKFIMPCLWNINALMMESLNPDCKENVEIPNSNRGLR